MKTITKEIRKAILCQNIGSKIVRFKTEGDLLTIDNLAYVNEFDLWEEITLVKIHPSEISDDDKTELARLNNEYGVCYHYTSEEGTDILISYKNHRMSTLPAILYQFLHSKNCALPYMDYSVKDLIELGVYKTK